MSQILYNFHMVILFSGLQELDKWTMQEEN